MYIAFLVILYFYIGYTAVCWINYRIGAGFQVHDFPKGMMDDPGLTIMYAILWPFFMIIHASIVIYDKFNLQTTINKISPSSFYKRGEYDNDLEIQAEKHLLGGK